MWTCDLDKGFKYGRNNVHLFTNLYWKLLKVTFVLHYVDLGIKYTFMHKHKIVWICLILISLDQKWMKQIDTNTSSPHKELLNNHKKKYDSYTWWNLWYSVLKQVFEHSLDFDRSSIGLKRKQKWSKSQCTVLSTQPLQLFRNLNCRAGKSCKRHTRCMQTLWFINHAHMLRLQICLVI